MGSHCMLDYINTHFMTFTYWVTIVIEFSGVVHASYLIRMMAYWAAGKPVESNEPEKEGFTLYFYWGRIVWSLAILTFALAVTIEALFRGATSLWEGVPEIIGLVLFFVLMACVGLLEGMQIAFFTVAKLPKSERGDSKLAMKVCHCLFKDGGMNLPGFMCGRQMTVTLCFLGAITTTILGSIAWQLVAGAFPIGFLSNPIVYIFLQAALFLEATGICAAAWFFAYLQKKVMKFQFDEVYVGTPEERAAKGYEDKAVALDMGTAMQAHAVGKQKISREFMDIVQNEFANQREKVMANISDLREQIKASDSYEDRKIFEAALKLEVDALKQVNARQSQSMRDLTAMLEGGDDSDDEDGKGDEEAGMKAAPVKNLEDSDDDI